MSGGHLDGLGDVERHLAELRRAVEAFLQAASRVSSGGGIRLTITDDAPGGTRGLDRVFVGLGATIDAFPDVLRSVVPEIRAAHSAVFSSEGALGRGKWAPLKPATLADRRRKGFPPGPILLRTGALKRHVLGTSAQIRTVGGTTELRIAPSPVVEGTGRPYYRAQALGYGALPSRPMVAVGPAAAVKITSAISRELRRRAAMNGL